MKSGPSALALVISVALLISSAICSNSQLAIVSVVLLILSTAGTLSRWFISQRTAAAILGLIVGTGGMLDQLASGASSWALVPFLAALAVPVAGRIKWIENTITVAGVALVVGIAVTVQEAVLTSSRIISLVTVLMAARVVISDAGKDAVRQAATAAGVSAAIGVFISWLVGRPLFSAQALEYTQTSSGAIRAAGFQSHPNEAAIVLSASLIVILAHAFEPKDRLRSRLQTASVYFTSAMIAGALILTGSRSALIGATAIFGALALHALRTSRLGTVLKSLSIAAIALIFFVESGTFTGRGFDLWDSNDGSAIYRSDARQAMLGRLDYLQMGGFGLDNGYAVSDNPVSSGIGNIDNAWLYSGIAYGLLVTLAIGLVLVVLSLLAVKKDLLVGLGVLIYWCLVSNAENVFGLAGAAIAFIFVFDACLYRANLPRPAPGVSADLPWRIAK